MPNRQQSARPGPTKAAILKDSVPGWLKVVTPYQKDFVEDLKTIIQPSHRKWDPIERVWHVNELFLEELAGLLKMYFDEVSTDLGQPSQPPDNMFIQVFSALKGMPNNNLDGVYRALAIAVHPDHGGSDDLMTKLNQAYQEAK
mgnify:CR=1 FL=1